MLAVIKTKIEQLKTKKVVQNMVLVTGISLIISLLGFVKEAITAASFGLSIQLDTFFVAILIPGLINTVFLGSYNSVFVPNYINEIHIGGNLKGFQSTSFIITIGLSLSFVLLSFLGTDFFLEYMYPNKSIIFYSLVKQQFYIIIPSILFWGLSSLIVALLNINNEYLWSTLSGIFTPIVFISALLIYHKNLPDSILAWSTTLGAISSTIYLFLVARKKNIIFLGKYDFNNQNIKTIFQQLPAKISSGLLTALNAVVDQFFAAQLVIGSITALNYGLKIPAFATSILMIAFSNVLLPFFTKSVLSNKKKSFENLFKNIKWTFLVLFIISMIGVLLSEIIVTILFERQEFTYEDTKLVSQIQQIFLIYVPFKITGSILVNFAISLNENRIMAYFSLFALILNIILDIILMRIYGIYGIAICTTIVISLKTIGMYFYLRKLSKMENKT